MTSTLPTADIEAAPAATDAEIALVRKHAEAALTAAQTMARLEAELTTAQTAFKQTIEHDLPTAMIAARLETWPLPGGARFDLTPIIGAGIPKDATEEAHKWLEDHGHADLIKHRIQILFGRGDESWVKKFLADCAKRKRPLDLARKDWVEPQTLGAFVREQIRNAAAEGRDAEEAIPSKIFGIYKATIAKFIPPKVKK